MVLVLLLQGGGLYPLDARSEEDEDIEKSLHGKEEVAAKQYNKGLFYHASIRQDINNEIPLVGDAVGANIKKRLDS